MRTLESERLRIRKIRERDWQHYLELNRKHNKTYRLKDLEAYRKMAREYKKTVFYPKHKLRLALKRDNDEYRKRNREAVKRYYLKKKAEHEMQKMR